MAKLIWDKIGDRLYENGVRRGVLYPQNVLTGLYPLGVAWNGLTGVSESPSGGEANPVYADDIKYLNLDSAEDFAATIEAYTYPDEFGECDGSYELATGVYITQQKRKPFGLAYRTALGNDVEGGEYGYKLHLVYGAMAAPSEKSYETINDSPEAITFSWEISTMPIMIDGYRPTAHLVIDSTKVSSEKMTALENILYGTDNLDPMLPLPNAVVDMFAGADPSELALSSIVPDDDADAIAVHSDIVMTFNNKILHESIVVTKDDGSIVEGTKSFDSTGKILTFNPTLNLTGSSNYIVIITGVVDIYGQSLASVVKNFSTAA